MSDERGTREATPATQDRFEGLAREWLTSNDADHGKTGTDFRIKVMGGNASLARLLAKVHNDATAERGRNDATPAPGPPLPCGDDEEEREVINGMFEERTNNASAMPGLIDDVIKYVQDARYEVRVSEATARSELQRRVTELETAIVAITYDATELRRSEARTVGDLDAKLIASAQREHYGWSFRCPKCELPLKVSEGGTSMRATGEKPDPVGRASGMAGSSPEQEHHEGDAEQRGPRDEQSASAAPVAKAAPVREGCWDGDLVDRFMRGETIAEASQRTGVLPEYVERSLHEQFAERMCRPEARPVEPTDACAVAFARPTEEDRDRARKFLACNGSMTQGDPQSEAIIAALIANVARKEFQNVAIRREDWRKSMESAAEKTKWLADLRASLATAEMPGPNACAGTKGESK